MRAKLMLAGGVAGVLALGAAAAGQQPALEYRWVYMAHNLQVKENADEVQRLMRRAKAVGYNGVCLADYKLQILDTVPRHYFANLDAVKATAKELGMGLYPAVCQVGHAGGILSHDPNLIEGQQVRDGVFVAGGDGWAGPAAAGVLENGGFEDARGEKLAGYFMQDSPGQSTRMDGEIVHGGSWSLRMERIGELNPEYGNCRVAQAVKVAPWRQYHISAWIRTEGFDRAANVRIQALAGSERLSSTDLGVKPTQGWTRHDVVFNSGEHTSVNVYFGVWGGKGGRIWWDDAAVEEAGLLNVIRRPGAPLTVRAEGGGAVYEEGRDFEPVRDPKMGTVPWPGSYGVYHEPPRLRLTPGSRIRAGERLLVSYTHAITTEEGKAALCLSEPGSYALLEAEAKRVVERVGPAGLFMAHDEIRVMNWCGACRGRGLTPGAMLADNAGRCAAICAGALGGRGEVFVWSDMFDPHHNAVERYYLVNGTLAGSWEGLPRSVVVVNWNSWAAGKSLAFFDGRGNRQLLAGYYDAPVERIRPWMEEARSLKTPLAGVMYTTWRGNYADLEAFARAAWGAE